MAISSRTSPGFDISEAGFTGAARDVGEVVALLSGGVRPDPDILSRLVLSMRALQGFLIEEARQQGYRATITGSEALREAVLMVEAPAPEIGVARVRAGCACNLERAAS